MILSAGGAVTLAGIFIAEAGEFVAAADAVAVTSFRSGFEGNEGHEFSLDEDTMRRSERETARKGHGHKNRG